MKLTTADKKHSGSPQRVLLVIVGQKGNSPVFEFKTSSHSPKFQRGQTDTFQIACKDIGPLKAVRVAHCPRRKHSSPGRVRRNVFVVLILSTLPLVGCIKWYLFEVCLTRLVDKQKYVVLWLLLNFIKMHLFS